MELEHFLNSDINIEHLQIIMPQTLSIYNIFGDTVNLTHLSK